MKDRTASLPPSARPSKQKPRLRDPEATMQRILKASRAEFAKHGYMGARIDRIARTADINKRMLYHYVGNKDALYLEALEATYRDIRGAEQGLALDNLEPPKAIEQLVRFTWSYFLENPEFIALLNTENLHKAKHLKRSREIGRMNSTVVATVENILQRGARQGLFRPGIDALQLYISIASLCYFYLSNQHTLPIVFGRELKSKEALTARVDHVVDLVLNGIRR